MLVSPPIVAPTSCAVVEVDSGAMFGYPVGKVFGDIVYCSNDIARLARYRVTTLLYRIIRDGRNIPLIRVL